MIASGGISTIEDILALRDMVEIGVEVPSLARRSTSAASPLRRPSWPRAGQHHRSNSHDRCAATGRSVQRLDGRLRDLLPGRRS